MYNNHKTVIISDGTKTRIMVDGKEISNIVEATFSHKGGKGAKVEITYDGFFPEYESMETQMEFGRAAEEFMKNPQS